MAVLEANDTQRRLRSATALSSRDLSLKGLSLTRLLRAFILLAAMCVIVTRVYLAAKAPLWLDETWSAMIATRPDWQTFWHEAWLDCNPPFYYLLLTAWVRIFGDSNFMLRLPSVLSVIGAAILPVVWRPKGLNQSAAWTWAGLILLWPPGTLIMLDSRGYALIIMLSTASCLVFAKSLEHLSRKLAIAWVALGTMMFLTHYFTAVLIAAQCLIMIVRHRAALLRVWPAALVAVPGPLWFAIHLPRLKVYARPDVVWQHVTDAGSSLADLCYLVGALNLEFLCLIAVIVILAGFDRKVSLASNNVRVAVTNRNLSLVAATAVVGFGLAIMIGVVQASLIPRYLVPLVPPTLLGLVLIVQKSTRQELGCLLLIFVFLIPSLYPKFIESLVKSRSQYGYEQGSDFVSNYHPGKLVFLWDHPATKIMDQTSLKEIGGYFMARAGVKVPVEALVVPEGANPNAMLRIAAHGQRPAVIWLYDTDNSPGARNYLPTFANDPEWTCQRQRFATTPHSGTGSVACVKLGSHT